MVKKKKNLTEWEIAKPLLIDEYTRGKLTDDMPPKDVHESRFEYVAVPYNRFRDNYARLRRTIRKDKVRAEDDEARFLHDTSMYVLAKHNRGCWTGSPASKLLKYDMKKGRHKRYKPEILLLKRKEYQKFSLECFRKHIHQYSRETLMPKPKPMRMSNLFLLLPDPPEIALKHHL